MQRFVIAREKKFLLKVHDSQTYKVTFACDKTGCSHCTFGDYCHIKNLYFILPTEKKNRTNPRKLLWVILFYLQISGRSLKMSSLFRNSWNLIPTELSFVPERQRASVWCERSLVRLLWLSITFLLDSAVEETWRHEKNPIGVNRTSTTFP